MSLLFWYRFDSSLTTDSSGNGLELTNDSVILSTDPNNGDKYANINTQNADLLLDSTEIPPTLLGNGAFTISVWIRAYVITGQTRAIYAIGSSSNKFRIEWTSDNKLQVVTSNTRTGATAYTNSSFHHIVVVYNPDDTSYTLRGYVDGSLQVFTNRTLSLPTNYPILIGDDYGSGNNGLYTYVSDLRAYSIGLDANAVTTLYNGGRLFENFTSLSSVMYTHLADLSWIPLPSASYYTIGISADGGSEQIVESSTTDLTYTLYNVSPFVSYVFNIYTNGDLVTPVASSTGSTPSVSSVSVASLISRLSNDLSILPPSAILEINQYINGAIATGTILKLTDNDEFAFVENSGTIEHTNLDILTPFDQGSGASQSITVTVDGETENIVYDEINNEIQTSGGVIDVGEYFVLGDYKVTVKDI